MSNVDKVITDAINNTDRIQKKHFFDITYWIIMFLIVGMVILTGLAEAKFDLSVLKDVGFWIPVGLTYIGSTMIMFLTADKSILKNEKEHQEYINAKKELQKQISISVFPDFEDWLIELNHNNKINAWVEKINRKITRLDNHAKQQDIDIWSSKNEEFRKNNKYCIKRKKLLSFLDKDYIKDNIPFLNVKYQHITKPMILSGARFSKKLLDIRKKGAIMTKDLMPRVLKSLAYLCFATSFVPVFEQFTFYTIFTIITRLISLFTSFYYGRAYGVRYIEEYELVLANQRLDYIAKYLSWKTTSKVKVNEDK